MSKFSAKKSFTHFYLLSMSALTLLGVGAGSTAFALDSHVPTAAATDSTDAFFSLGATRDGKPTTVTAKGYYRFVKNKPTTVKIPRIVGYHCNIKTTKVTWKGGNNFTVSAYPVYTKSDSKADNTPPKFKVFKSKVYATKQLKHHQFKKTYIRYSEAGLIYTTRSLKHWSHRGNNWMDTKWSTNQSVTVKKSNGKTGVYYYIKSADEGIKGWIWRGYLHK